MIWVVKRFPRRHSKSEKAVISGPSAISACSWLIVHVDVNGKFNYLTHNDKSYDNGLALAFANYQTSSCRPELQEIARDIYSKTHRRASLVGKIKISQSTAVRPYYPVICQSSDTD